MFLTALSMKPYPLSSLMFQKYNIMLLVLTIQIELPTVWNEVKPGTYRTHRPHKIIYYLLKSLNSHLHAQSFLGYVSAAIFMSCSLNPKYGMRLPTQYFKQAQCLCIIQIEHGPHVVMEPHRKAGQYPIHPCRWCPWEECKLLCCRSFVTPDKGVPVHVTGSSGSSPASPLQNLH